MKKDVRLTIRGTQTPPEGESETIELTTEAVMEEQDGLTTISYLESPLTGLSGTTTSFILSPDKIILERTGAVESTMEFVTGKHTESLYRIPEGALLLRVYCRAMEIHLDEASGWLSISYGIEIENVPAGTIDYHITIQPI